MVLDLISDLNAAMSTRTLSFYDWSQIISHLQNQHTSQYKRTAASFSECQEQMWV